MRNKEIKDLTFAAILMAMTVLLSLPYLLLPIGAVVITIAHIPVLVGAVLLGKKYGALLGAVMGLASMAIAIFVLGGNAPFTNPVLSVLPRVFFGWIIFIVYQRFTKWFKNRPLAIGLTMGVSTLIHSVVVLTIMYFVAKTGFYFTASENPITINEKILPFIIGILGTNSILEIAVAVLVGTPIILVMDKVINKED
jgi:uncharacterized membrane protein